MKDIVLKRIVVRNFLSVGNTPIEIIFKTDLNGITGLNFDLAELRSNGVGKSTIMDATFYALYGETIRNIKTSGIKNYVTNKEGLVELEFSVNNINYRIERSVAPHKIKFYENGEEKTKSTVAENNNYILSIINCSPELAKNSIFTSINDTIPFMAQDAKLKRKFSEGILNISFISEILKTLREEYNVVQKQYDKAFAELEATKKNQKQYSEEIDLWNNNRTKVLGKLNDDIISLEKQIQQKREILVEIDEDAENQKYTEIFDKISIVEKELEKRKNQAQYAYDDAVGGKHKTEVVSNQWKPKDNLDDVKNKIINIEKKIKELGEIEDVSTSKEILDVENNWFLQNKNEIDKNIKALNAEYTNIFLSIRSNSLDVDKLNQENDKLLSLKGNCPTCLHSLEGSDGNHIKIHIEENNHKIVKLNEKILEQKKEATTTQDAIDKLKADLVKFEEKKRNAETSFNNKANTRNSAIKLNGELTSLKSIIESDGHRATMYNNFLEQIKENDALIIKNRELLDKILPKIEEVESKKNKAQENYNDIKSKIKNNKAILDNIKASEALLQNYFQQKQNKEKEECRFITLLQNNEKEINRLTEVIDELDVELKAGEILKGVFSEEGAKTYITKKIIDVLNRRIAYYIQKYQFKIKIVLDEFFEDKIFNQKDEECSYFNFSGAERKSIDLAILFAFIDLRKIQGDVNINTLFFDEILDSSMDKTGIQITLDILKERVDNYNEAIYVISHRKESLSNFDGEIIELEKRNGITTRK